jgi:hypothetical protein
MLTLFAVPRPFAGEFARIQRNALNSWRALGDQVEIVLIGSEAGVAEEAADIRAAHVPTVQTDEWGTPLVNDVFRIGVEVAQGEWLAYVNADILLMNNFLLALDALRGLRKPLLVIGQRWDLDLQASLDFSDATWDRKLVQEVKARGKLHAPSGIDYFLFRRGTWNEIPPFALGRTMWDNWLVFSARARGLAVVDATCGILAIHQNHGYGFYPKGSDSAWKGAEAERNLQLAGGLDHYFTIEDATHRLEGARVRPALDRTHLLRRGKKLPILWAPAATLSASWRKASGAVYKLRVRIAKWRGRV